MRTGKEIILDSPAFIKDYPFSIRVLAFSGSWMLILLSTFADNQSSLPKYGNFTMTLFLTVKSLEATFLSKSDQVLKVIFKAV